MEARNIAMCHYHASDKHKALQRIIDAALQKKEFVQFARETAAYISDHKVRMDVLRRIEQTAQA